MTPKIERFLAEHRPETPCLVVDLEVVEENFRRLKHVLPLATIYYAVKANPAAEVLRTLADLGSSFDAASVREIDQCLAVGAGPDRISYGNTIKKTADIRHAYECGLRMYAFDSAAELEKLALAAPRSKVYCRILTSSDGADWPLSRKFGCDLDMARDLMIRARDMGLEPYGISFHVGSQQTDPRQWEIAVARTAMVFSDLREAGIEPRMVNLGGGFPVRYQDDIAGIDAFADAIMKAMTKHFGNDLPAMIVEPGRSIAAEAGVLQAEVVLVANKSYGDDLRWVYLDVGKFGGLAETMNEAIKYPIRVPRNGDKAAYNGHIGGKTASACPPGQGPVVIAGPTCDGADILYENSGYTLPMDLKAGDRVQLLAAGTYTTTYASVGFNGFSPLKAYYI